MSEDAPAPMDHAALRRAILGSAEQDSPPPGARERLLGALAAGAAAGAGGAAGTGTLATSSFTSAAGKLAAWSLGGALAVGAAVAGVTQTGALEGPPLAQATAPARAAEKRDTACPSRAAPADRAAAEAIPETSRPTRASPAAPTARPLAAAKAPEAPPVPSLGDEVRALDAVRGALLRGDCAAAKDGLRAYDARFPQGTLKPEAATLRGRRCE